jgi:uncharacterized protein YlxW (UPF0749 family)
MAAMPAPPAAHDRPAGTTRRDDSMLLLRNLVEDSLDEGYARAAARREEGAPRSRATVWVLTAGLLAVGLLLTTAYVQTRDRAGSAQQARDALVAEVENRADANERTQRQLDRLRTAVRRDQQNALQLTDAGAALSARLAGLEAVTGAGPVTGPGMTVRLEEAASDDDADVDPRTDQTDDGRVTDRDLQTVVNEVWAAGAEAIAVNGQRLTALSAIRSAGDAVLVDFRPLNPPYVIEAVGDPDTLRSSFVGGFGGSYLQVLQGYGITYAVKDADRLELPASVGVSLRYAAEPAPADGPADQKDKKK